MLPGPIIKVCEGDTVVVDVSNLVKGQSITIHWHGMFQRGSQYSDGVSMVTQCPILESNTFRYKFVAYPGGTHFWHSHSGLQKVDGVQGPLIVRQPPSKDPYAKMIYKDHIFFLNDWMHNVASERFPGISITSQYGIRNQLPHNILINGKGNYTNPTTGITTDNPLEVFEVKAGERYRFRVIGATTTVCPLEITIESHAMTCIATDGEVVKPKEMNHLAIFTGERYDFILDANKSGGSYWIQVRALGSCEKNNLFQLAILRYTGASKKPTSDSPTPDKYLPRGKILNPPNSECDESNPDEICVTGLRSYYAPQDSDILKENADNIVMFNFTLYHFKPSDFNNHKELDRGYEVEEFMVNEGLPLVFQMNSLVYKASSWPLLSQYSDIPKGYLCNSEDVPSRCEPSKPCFCTHVHQLKWNTTVDLVIIAGAAPAVSSESSENKSSTFDSKALSHPFHVHGHMFYVMDMGIIKSTEDVERLMSKNRSALLHQRLHRPPAKDTVAIPSRGYVVLRFKPNNPGCWLFHCHVSYHIASGMSMVFQVGKDNDWPPVPNNFPRCGDYMPPIWDSNDYY